MAVFGTRRSRLTSLAAGAALLTSLVVAAPDATVAASPDAGSIDPDHPSVTWTGGPFAAPNATGTALDDPDCSVPGSCDDYQLSVTTPAGYGDAHRLTINVSWADTAADFDVYVYDAAGNRVGTSASSADPEQVVTLPDTGTYTVRVVPFAPLAQTYTATASLTDLPAAPAPGTATPPPFTAYAAPASLAAANDAGEPSIGANWKSGATLFQAGLSTLKVGFDDTTSPASASWSDVSASAANGCPQGSTTSLDPILWTDHQTGRTIESQLSGVDSLTCTTDDDGATWAPSQGGGIPSGVDHQTIGGGPYAASALPNLGLSDYPDIVYYCSQDIATAFCATSHDGGTTFGAGVPVYSLLDCGGLHGHVKVAPDGTAYVPNKSCGSTQGVVTSTDNGATWKVSPVPGSTPGDSDPSVGVGSNGTVYFGYVGADGRPAVAVSHDRGATWTDNQPVGSEFNIQNAVFPAVVAGDDDRAAFAYLGTPTAGDHSATGSFDGVWHLYVTTTYDGGKSWQTSDATPTDPVQRGSVCTSGTTCGDDRNLLDFIDVTIDDHGRVEVGFADGCVKTCVTDPSQSSGAGPADAQAAWATIARQSGGKTLFSRYDVVTPAKKKHRR